MYNLGYHYQFREKNYELMKQYYLMAIERGNSVAMNNLGVYYKNVEKNYDLMKQYFSMAVEKGNSDAMYNLGFYYGTIENKVKLMKRYYLMAIEHNHENKKGLLNNLLLQEFDFSIAAKYSNLLNEKNLDSFKLLSEQFKQQEFKIISEIHYHYYLVNESTNGYLENSLVYLVLSIIKLQSTYYDLN